LVLLVIIIPLTNLIIYGAQKSVVAYYDLVDFFNNSDINKIFDGGLIAEKTKALGLSGDKVQTLIVDLTKQASNWLVGGATSLIKGTTGFLISLAFIVFTMFFFFVDGKKMLKRVMYWTPLPNKYDREIFKKFKDVSYSTFVSTFVVAVVQGVLGAIGFMIVGLPAFFAGIAIAFLSIAPYVGSIFVTVPAGIYLLAVGEVWQGAVMLIVIAPIVGNIDNLIRAYMIKGKAQVHPIFLIFAILGGIILFGFWGVVIGPLIIALTITIMHIYELEYKDFLEE
jgi:predicted PurR-regulated permease PerM